MESLLAIFEQTWDAHPVVRSAWLHHRFVCVHPFQDGNGRVARALTLLVLLRNHYAPLVVDRNQRADYLDALDEANEGDLRPLVRLFGAVQALVVKELSWLTDALEAEFRAIDPAARATVNAAAPGTTELITGAARSSTRQNASISLWIYMTGAGGSICG
jgi:fido (protein-threonine AMPylation protein)